MAFVTLCEDAQIPDPVDPDPIHDCILSFGISPSPLISPLPAFLARIL